MNFTLLIHTFSHFDGRWHVFVVDRYQKVILEENIANDREEIDENQCQNSCEYDRSSVSGHRADHIQQGLFAIDDIEKLLMTKLM